VLEACEGRILALTFSPDGRFLALAEESGRVLIYDLAGRESVPATVFQGPEHFFADLAFSPDGQLLAGANREQVKIWHVPTGQEVLVLQGALPPRGDRSFNPRIAWSPDGQSLAVVNHDTTVSIWDTSDADPSTRYRAAETRAFSWHLAHALSAARNPRMHYGAEFHIQALSRLKPPNDEAALELAVLDAWLGKWQDAAARFAAVHARQPLANSDYVYPHALLRLRAGDLRGWREACADLQARFNSWGPQSWGRACLFGADSTPGPAIVLRELASLRGSNGEPWRMLLGGAYYRAERFPEALQVLEEFLRVDADPIQPQTWLFLAMANCRMGRTEQGRKWLQRFEEWQEQRYGNKYNDDLVLVPSTENWVGWLEMQILYREASALLQAAGK
jgi:tetratricopeptide (TPR) repeat protein